MNTRTVPLLMLLICAGVASAQSGLPWRLAAAPGGPAGEPGAVGPVLPNPGQPASQPLFELITGPPLGFESDALTGDRPRLTVSLSPGPSAARSRASDRPAFSWSIEAWEMNTASLAHIQCSRARRTLESFLVEDCRFVDGPLPEDSASLVQVRGRWMAAPGVEISAGAYSGQQPVVPSFGGVLHSTGIPGLSSFGRPATDQIEGVNMNVSFGLQMGQVGDLLLDLQLERYRRKPEPFSLDREWMFPLAGGLPGQTGPGRTTSYASSGELGVQWRSRSFSADLTGQYRELPYWFGEQLEGEGFRSFDIELSWRAPARSSLSVGISNILDRLPGAATNAGEPSVEEAVDGIYGRIPYVRYKHDL